MNPHVRYIEQIVEMHTDNTKTLDCEHRSLAECTAGARGWIVSVQEGPDANRLKAMGLCVGHAVQVVRAGDPMVLDIFNTRMALAKTLAIGIRITDFPEHAHA